MGNPVARRKRLHESSTDQKKKTSIKDTIEGNMKNPEHKVTTNLQAIKEENSVARRERLHKSSTIQRKMISTKDIIEGNMKNPEHKVTTNLQDNRGPVHPFKKKIEGNIKNMKEKEIYNTPEIHVRRAKLRSIEVFNEYIKNQKINDPVNITEEDKEVLNKNVTDDKQKVNLTPNDGRQEKENEIKLENVENTKIKLETVQIKAKAKKKKKKKKKVLCVYHC